MNNKKVKELLEKVGYVQLDNCSICRLSMMPLSGRSFKDEYQVIVDGVYSMTPDLNKALNIFRKKKVK